MFLLLMICFADGLGFVLFRGDVFIDGWICCFLVFALLMGGFVASVGGWFPVGVLIDGWMFCSK